MNRNVNEQMSKRKRLITKEKFIHGESPTKIPNWRLIDSPDRPDCVESEEGIEIYTTKNNIKYVRTPEERFQNLKDFPYEPHYVQVEDLRMHYIDEGSQSGEVILLLHGQPSWSYLYRKMIPILANANFRVIAVDNIGTGRSDKPIDIGFHTYEHHVAILKKFIAALKLENITLFCQDWGGVFGIRVVGDQPESFARVVAAHTIFPVIFPKGMNPILIPNPIKLDCALKDVDFKQFAGSFGGSQETRPKEVPLELFFKFFQFWVIFTLTHPNFSAGEFIQSNTVYNLNIEELAAYDAPYPSLIYQAAPRTFPSMLAGLDQNNVEAWKTLGKFDKPFLFLAGKGDPSFGSIENQKIFTDHIPGTKGQDHQLYPNADHFIQEDIGVELANKLISLIKANPM